MLRVPVIELFLRLIPEGFLFVFAGYVFSRKSIDNKRFIISSLLLGIVGYIIRWLPINYGVHSILVLISCILINSSINKIEVVKAISAGIITMILGFISDGVNVFLIQNVLGKDTKVILENSMLKLVYGFPSLIILFLFISFYYFIISRRKGLKKS